MPPIRIDDPDVALADMMTEWPQTIPVFVRHKMLCVGCLVSPFHTLGDACAEYHLDERTFIAELKQAIDRPPEAHARLRLTRPGRADRKR